MTSMPSSPRFRVALLSLVATLGGAGLADAQITGGRFGGSRWNSPSASPSTADPGGSPRERRPRATARSPERPSTPSFGGSDPRPSSPVFPSFGSTSTSHSVGSRSRHAEAPSDSPARPPDGPTSQWVGFAILAVFVVFALWVLISLGRLALMALRKPVDWNAVYASTPSSPAPPPQSAVAPRPPGPAPVPVVAPISAPGFSVRRVSLGFDATARRRLQAGLDSLQAEGAASADPLHAAALGARRLLRSSLPGARYALVEGHDVDASTAERRFTSAADDLRGRYTVETRSGGREVPMPGLASRAEEGDGFVVISMLVAASEALPRDYAASPGSALDALLPERPGALVALEVIWSPAEENDRLSSAELEALYPELEPLAGGAPVGRVTCGHCAAVFAAELGRCPRCGAPVAAG